MEARRHISSVSRGAVILAKLTFHAGVSFSV
jgi:hypothetical protein